MRLRDHGQYTSMVWLPGDKVGVFYDCWENRNYQLYFTTFSLNDIK